MSDLGTYRDIGVSLDGNVATVEIRRPPHNFFDSDLIFEIGEAFERLDANDTCRAIVLCADGRSFCAGADFSKRMDTGTVNEGSRSGAGKHLYKEASRLFRTKKPIIGAIHGAAVGGGLGLALVPDFRVTCSEARFSANFNRLGFHPGFGLTATLPRLVGEQQAALLFYTGRRIPGDEAVRIGLADLLVPQDEVRKASQALALKKSRNRRRWRWPRPARRGAAAWSTRSTRRPSASWSSRTGCAAPKISRKASRPCPTAACRISRGGEADRQRSRWPRRPHMHTGTPGGKHSQRSGLLFGTLTASRLSTPESPAPRADTSRSPSTADSRSS